MCHTLPVPLWAPEALQSLSNLLEAFPPLGQFQFNRWINCLVLSYHLLSEWQPSHCMVCVCVCVLVCAHVLCVCHASSKMCHQLATSQHSQALWLGKGGEGLVTWDHKPGSPNLGQHQRIITSVCRGPTRTRDWCLQLTKPGSAAPSVKEGVASWSSISKSKANSCQQFIRWPFSCPRPLACHKVRRKTNGIQL